MKKLTVGEVIELLQKYPYDLPILVHSYEDGWFCDPVIKEELVVTIKDHADWQGPYASFAQEGGPVAGYMNALVFGRDKSGG